MGFIEWIESFRYTEKKAADEIMVVSLCVRFVEDEIKKLLSDMKTCKKEQDENDLLIEKYIGVDLDELYGVEKATYDNMFTKYKSLEARMGFMENRSRVLNDICEALSSIKNSAQALVDNGMYKEVIKAIPEKLLPRMVKNIKETENILQLVTGLKVTLNEMLVKYSIAKEYAQEEERKIDAKNKIMNESLDEKRKEREKEQYAEMVQAFQKRKQQEKPAVRAVDMPIVVTEDKKNVNTNKN